LNSEKTPKLAWIKVEEVRIPEFRLSSQFTEEEDEEFHASLELDGILNPIIVIEDDNGMRWLADGVHRLEVAKRLGHKLVPAIIIHGTVKDAILKSALLNLKRGRVNPGSLAEFIKGLIERYGWSQEKIADLLRLSKPYVSQLASIAQHPEVLEKLKKGDVTQPEAYKIVKSLVTKPSLTVKPATAEGGEVSAGRGAEVVGGEAAEAHKRLPITDEDIKVNTEGEGDKSPRRCDFCGQWMSREEFSYIIVHKGLCKQRAMEAIQKATMNPQPQPGGERESAGGLRKGGGGSG
jgi:ParB/RepB/Spo0J family partition protein